MTPVLLTALLLFQAGAINQSDAGTLTGTIRLESGEPAKGLRVAVVLISDSALQGTSDLLSIAETNDSGLYALQNVPPGRYYVIAGSLSSPTYYPGTVEASRARAVSVVAGARLSNMDFSITEVGLRTAQNARQQAIRPSMTVSFGRRVQTQTLSGKVLVQDGPSSSALGMLVVARRRDGFSTDALVKADGSFQLQLEAGDYSISTLLVPLGYSVKSVVAGTVDLMGGKPLSIQVPNANIAILEISLERPKAR